MADDIDRYVKDRQREIADRSRSVYSDTAVERFYNPRNLGRLTDPDAHGIVHGWCGDTMEIYLRVVEGRIRAARFMTDGCGPTVACGSMLTSMVEGLSQAEALEIAPQQLIDALGGLPRSNAHCAKLAVDALRAALSSS